MENTKNLFHNSKVCEGCKRPLPNDYEDKLCPRCLEMALFHKVKEYIRTNDVTEYQVADHFQIPLMQVKAWIKEGRIEYKETNPSSKISTLRCQRCGEPVAFGSFCTKCLRYMNGNKVYSTGANPGTTKSKMYHLEGEE